MEESILKIDNFGTKIWVKPEKYNDTKGFNWTKENGIYIHTYDGHLIHKTDGPAIEYSSGTKYWLQNGKKHREDGPAIEWSNGTKYWYWHDKRFGTKQQWLVHKLKTIRDGRISSQNNLTSFSR